jgi:hypothetical protein
VVVAARRVKPATLAKAVRLRDQRQQGALKDLKTALTHLEAARDACADARQEVMSRQALRHAGETQAYGKLAQAGPLPPVALERHLAAIESFTNEVRSASQRLDQAEGHKLRADEAASSARSHYVTRARQARKWAQLSEMVAISRRARAEHLAEVDADEEGSSRPRRAHVPRGAVR